MRLTLLLLWLPWPVCLLAFARGWLPLMLAMAALMGVGLVRLAWAVIQRG